VISPSTQIRWGLNYIASRYGPDARPARPRRARLSRALVVIIAAEIAAIAVLAGVLAAVVLTANGAGWPAVWLTCGVIIIVGAVAAGLVAGLRRIR
jgi:hypothetical protein